MVAEQSIIPSFDVQRHFGATIDRVRGGETLVVTTHRRPIYAIVPIDVYNDLIGTPATSGRFDDEPNMFTLAVE